MDLIQKEKPKKELSKDPVSAPGEHVAPLMAPNHIAQTNAFADSQEMKEEKKSETMETVKRMNSDTHGQEGMPPSIQQQQDDEDIDAHQPDPLLDNMEIIVPSQAQQLDGEGDKDQDPGPEDENELTNAGFNTAGGHGAMSDQTGGG